MQKEMQIDVDVDENKKEGAEKIVLQTTKSEDMGEPETALIGNADKSPEPVAVEKNVEVLAEHIYISPSDGELDKS